MAQKPVPPAAGQIWSAHAYATNAGFVPSLGADVLALLAPQPGEHILDLGCGDGVLTAHLAQSGAIVTGLEPDPDLANAARAKGISVLQQDAHDPFGQAAYDAVFSNAALHWMRQPAVVFANVFAALRPGGRLIAEQGGAGNVARIVAALNAARAAEGLAAVTPWDFPTPDQQQSRLQAVGFDVAVITLIPRPTPLPTGVAGWLRTFAGPFVAGFADDLAARILLDAERGLADGADAGVADYVRLRFAARKPNAP